MKGTPLKFNYAPKMMGRNSAYRFASYKSDGSQTAEQEEKDFLESIKDFSEDQQAIAKAARKSFSAKLEGFMASVATKEEIEPLISKALEEMGEEFKTMPQVLTALKAQVAAQSTVLSKMRSNLDAPAPKTLKALIEKEIQEKAELIKNADKGTAVEIEFGATKAVTTVTTGSSTSPTTPPDLTGVTLVPPTNAAIREDSLMDLVTQVNTSMAVYPYTETLPKEGDFTFQSAEGVLKDQLDFKTETRYATPVTLAAWEEITTQALDDIPGLQSIATDLLFKKHNRKKMKGILSGSGASGEPKGAVNYASAFTCPASLQNTVPQPNIMDLINGVATVIFTTHDYQDQLGYRANVALMHPYDFYLEFVASKDGFGRPLFPQAAIFNQVTIGGMTIRPWEDITAGSIFIGDLSKYNVSNYVGYKVIIGRINDNLVRNKLVVLGESRFHAFVKKLDEKAFVYDTIANIRGYLQKAS